MNVIAFQNVTIPLKYGNSLLDYASTQLSEKVLLPTIRGTYEVVGLIAANALGCLSNSLKGKITEYWHDPFSSNFLLKITRPVEKLSRIIAEETPTHLPILHYFQTCIISSAQHLHRNTKEINYLLSLPQNLKYYAATLSFDRFINKPSIFLGRSWEWVSGTVLLLKRVLLHTINLIIKVIDKIISAFTLRSDVQLLGYIREIVKESIEKVNIKFVEIAHQTIEKREAKIRKAVIASATNATVEYLVTNLSTIFIKSAFGIATYLPLRSTAQDLLKDRVAIFDAAALMTVGISLWFNVFKPNLDAYYKTYHDNYDSNASHLKAFCNQYCISHFYAPLEAVRFYLQDLR